MKWIIFFYVLQPLSYEHTQVDCIVINQHTVQAFGEEWYITPSRVKMKHDTYKDKIYKGFFYLKNGRKQATLLINGRMAVFTRLGDREQQKNVIVDQLPHYWKYYAILNEPK